MRMTARAAAVYWRVEKGVFLRGERRWWWGG
jgi:hypothetical protein